MDRTLEAAAAQGRQVAGRAPLFVSIHPRQFCKQHFLQVHDSARLATDRTKRAPDVIAAVLPDATLQKDKVGVDPHSTSVADQRPDIVKAVVLRHQHSHRHLGEEWSHTGHDGVEDKLLRLPQVALFVGVNRTQLVRRVIGAAIVVSAPCTRLCTSTAAPDRMSIEKGRRERRVEQPRAVALVERVPESEEALENVPCGLITRLLLFPS
mmetsp:Transcript_12635/g.25122  ORF Transcript_12635/g.25122 Transcript_12635/m.25122 type:complete len:209 (-) Transcript_12635:2194-2820(-)